MKFSCKRTVLGTVLTSLLLAGCGIFGSQVNMDLPKEVVQVCAPVGIVARTGTLTRFVGEGRDYDDVEIRGTISGLSAKCTDTPDGVRAIVDFDIVVQKGPAATLASLDLDYFVAISQRSDELLDKRVYSTTHAFPPGQTRSVVHETLAVDMPVSDDKTTGGLEVLIGFQLDRSDLEYNVFR